MPSDSDWYSDANATFGDRLAAARDHAGLSQADVADRLGVKTAVIAAWEDDIKEPRANRLAMLAGIYSISLSWLMTGQGDGPDGPPEDTALPGDVLTLLSEMRSLRAEIAQASERLGQLEKRLRRALEVPR